MRKLRLMATLFVLPWLLMAAVGARYVSAAPVAQAGPQTFTVLTGAGFALQTGEKPSWQGQNFYPASITVNIGDSIVWKHNSGNEPHTVTFLGPVTDPGPPVIPDPAATMPVGSPPKLIINPMHANPAGGPTYDGSAFTNSGQIAADIPVPQEFKLTFTKAGTYDYLCLLHSGILPNGMAVGMVGKVVVQDAGSAYPMTPEQVMAEGQRLIAADMQKAMDLNPVMEETYKPAEQMADGSTMHHVAVGNMDMSRNLEFERFAPTEIRVKAGDTVEWSLGMAPAFHTVTFGDEPDLFTIEPQPQGPPNIVLNNDVLFPVGPNVHTGTGYYNSGILAGPNDPPEMGLKSYSLKFTQPGRYEYICVPHYSLGMIGTVVVEAATTTGGTPVGMPQTGAGDAGWLLPGLLALALALSGIAVRVASHKRKSA